MPTVHLYRRENPRIGPPIEITHKLHFETFDAACKRAYLIALQDSKDPSGEKHAVPYSPIGYYRTPAFWGFTEICVTRV